MPRLWTENIESHRREVRSTIIDAAAALLEERGLSAVTMSAVAERASIGRATLYKYFSGVTDILVAWHARGVEEHVGQLGKISDQCGPALLRLSTLLETYALIDYQHHRAESHHAHVSDPRLAAVLHAGGHMPRAQRDLEQMVRQLVGEAVTEGEVRSDASPNELATFCLHALAAASHLPTKAAVRRLVRITVDGLRPPR